MIPGWLRLTICGVFLALAVVAAATGAEALVVVVIATLGALMGLAWVRYGDVPRAAKAYEARDRVRAMELLGKTPFGGRWLAREYRIYYHQVRAKCYLREERWEDAAREAESALGVRGIRDQAPACHVSAAEARLKLGDADGARKHLDAARTLPHNSAVDHGIRRVETQIAART